MKRFYQHASPKETSTGFEIHLDGRPVRTPAKAPLLVPTRALAEAIAAEWQAQGETIRPTTMPLTKLANTALDLTVQQLQTVIDQIAAYASTDLLCYRAGHPSELLAREVGVWQPLLDWVALRFDAILLVATGVMPRQQPEGACRALRTAIESYDVWRLTALQIATTGCGSVVIGLALLEGRITSLQAFEASQLHESFQMEQWGEDVEAAKRRATLRQDLIDTRRFVELLDTTA